MKHGVIVIIVFLSLSTRDLKYLLGLFFKRVQLNYLNVNLVIIDVVVAVWSHVFGLKAVRRTHPFENFSCSALFVHHIIPHLAYFESPLNFRSVPFELLVHLFVDAPILAGVLRMFLPAFITVKLRLL